MFTRRGELVKIIRAVFQCIRCACDSLCICIPKVLKHLDAGGSDDIRRKGGVSTIINRRLVGFVGRGAVFFFFVRNNLFSRQDICTSPGRDRTIKIDHV